MKITLISVTQEDLYSPCVRSLSAYLKREGYLPQIILMPGDTARYKLRHNYIYRYKRSLLDDMVDLSKGSDFIGVSFMSQMFDQGFQITEALKRALSIPVAWGGTHATMKPEDSLKYADMVCVGEGEEALLELIKKMERGESFFDVRNFYFKKDGKVIMNPLRPLIQNLDSLPFIDYDLDNQWVYDSRQKHLVQLNPKLLEIMSPHYPDRDKIMRPTYKTMITRGCPHKCSFCGVSWMHKIYEGQRYLRRRSNYHMIEELKSIKAKFPFIGMIHFQDDVFFSAPTHNIVEFAEMYKREIGLPLRAQCSPVTLNEEKFRAMVDAGLCFTELGIQSGSERTLKIYKRGMNNDHLINAVNIINKYSDKLNTPDFHFILDNPWETVEDHLDTLKLMWNLEGSHNLLPSSLIFFPGTEFYERAKAEGYLKDEFIQVYRKHFTTPNPCYLNFLFYLTMIEEFPNNLVKPLANKRLIKFFNRPFFNPLFRELYRMGELYRKFARVYRVFKKGTLFHKLNIRNIRKIMSYYK